MTMTSIPAFTPTEARDRSTFLALMWALSYPGRVQALPVAALSPTPFTLIADALLDLETSAFTSDPALIAVLKRTTARLTDAPDAEYLFFPTLGEADLPIVAQANIGEMVFPDRAAMLILGGQIGGGVGLRLTGPGIQGETSIQIGGLPVAFWELRNKQRRYPLGWDIFIVDGIADSARVIGLPRTTVIEIEIGG